MISKIIWELREDRSIRKVTKLTNRLYANSKASAEYNLISDAILPTDTVKMILTVGEKEYHKLLAYGNVLLETGETVKGWSIVSNGEELAVEIEGNGYETMIVSFEIKRFSTFDSQTLLTSFTSPQDTVLIYASSSYTPMVEPTDAELLENEISKINVKFDTKVDKAVSKHIEEWFEGEDLIIDYNTTVSNDGLDLIIDNKQTKNSSYSGTDVYHNTVSLDQPKYNETTKTPEASISSYSESSNGKKISVTPSKVKIYTRANGVWDKGDNIATSSDLAKKVDIAKSGGGSSSRIDIHTNGTSLSSTSVIGNNTYSTIITSTSTTPEIVLKVSKKSKDAQSGSVIDSNITITEEEITVKHSDSVKGRIATENYVDNKSTADRVYTDSRIDAIKKSVGYVFDTFDNFTKWIAGTYVRDDGVVVNDLNIGDDIFIVEEGVPDYWVKSKSDPMTITDFAPYESGDYKPTITWLEG